MAKVDFKKLLLENGEKGLMILGGVGLGGLLLWSVATALGGPDSPSTVTKKLDDQANRVNSAIARTEGGEVEPLPEWVKKPANFQIVDATQYPLRTPVYEPVNEPSKLRDLPPVLTPVPPARGGGVQVGLVRAPMPAYDVIERDGKVLIGVIKKVSIGANDKKVINDLRNNRPNRPAPRANPGGQQPPPGQPGGFPGGGLPGGLPGGGPAAGGGGGLDIGGPGGRPGGGMGGGFNANEMRTEQVVSYVTEDEFAKNPNLIPAITVHPLRMVSMQMAFPLKDQFEEIRKSLKLQTVSQAIEESGYFNGNLFLGLEVERQELGPDGKFYEWAKFDHEEEYRMNILNRKLGDVTDEQFASYYTLPAYAQRLAAPYPLLADGLGTYEPITLNCIAESIVKLKESFKTKTVKPPSNIGGGGDRNTNPFAPQSGGGGAQLGGLFGPGGGTGLGNMEGPGFSSVGGGMGGPGRPGVGGPGMGVGGPGMGVGGPGMGVGGPGMGGPGRPGMGLPGGGDGMGMPGVGGPGMPGMQNPNAGRVDPNYPLSEDFLLLRFLDPTVRTGKTYRYRVRVVMRNPNFGKTTIVAQDNYAKKERLESPWWPIPANVTIPGETNFYSITPKKYEEKVKEKFSKNTGMQDLLLPKDGKTVVQVHRWAEEVRLNANAREPIGSWILGEIPVGPGEYIGRKHLVQLPTWSSEKAAYALKELPGSLKVRGGGKDTPKGWLVDLSTDAVLVDFDGGKFRGQVAGYNVADDSEVEMLVVRADGSVMVRNSAIDETLPARDDRSKKWDEWLKKAESVAQYLANPAGGTGGGFGRPGGSPDGGTP
jgi:hypothetical protein